MIIFHFRQNLSLLILLLTVGLLSVSTIVQAGNEPVQDTTGIKLKFHGQNEKCLRCHGSRIYSFQNKVTGKEISATMNENMVIHRNGFYMANHKRFACTDCHSALYDTFPHPAELKLETQYNCIDCHGNDAKFARYHFEEIEAEFRQSVHFIAKGETFTCWKCHDPHSYKISIRNTKDITRSITYDNMICLGCHSGQKHDWLPNQALHFSQVRCIECHARLNDSLLVAHRIMPAGKAVKRCVECHSQNSLLVNSLYRYQSKDNRTKLGFLNAIILNNAFVIGANRNIILNRISISLILVVVGLLMVHFVLTQCYKKRE